MATLEDLADLLTDEEVDAIELVVQDKAMRNIQSGDLSEKEKIAVRLVDKMISESEALAQPLTIYRSLSGGSALHNAGEVTVPPFLTGSEKLTASSTKNIVTLAITVPKGTKVLSLPGGGYILQRGITLTLESGGGEIIDAKFKNASKPEFTATVISMSPTNAEDLKAQQEYLTQFHLPGQHDQSDHGHGGGGGKGSGGAGASKAQMSPEREKMMQEREARLRERETRLQKKNKVEKKESKRRNRQQVINTLLSASAIIAGIAATVAVFAPMVKDYQNKKQATQRREGGKRMYDIFNPPGSPGYGKSGY